MTPDLKRLCEAAVKAGDGEGLALDTYDGLPEAIVHAVLMELREMAEEAPKSSPSKNASGLLAVIAIRQAPGVQDVRGRR